MVGQLGGGQLVRARDRHHAVDARHALQPELADALGVADGADRGRQLAGQDEHVDAGGLEPRAHGRDLGLARLGCHHDHHRPSSRTPELVGAQVVRQLVAHRPRDLRAQLVRVVAEVAQQRVAEDDDAVRVVVARDAVALVEAVGAVAAALVGDHDGDVLERAQQQVGEVVERLAHELLEVGRVARVELHELALVGLGGEVLAREPLAAADELLELLLVGGVGVVGQPARDRATTMPIRPIAAIAMATPCSPRTRNELERPWKAVMMSTADAEAQARRGHDPSSGRPVREHHHRQSVVDRVCPFTPMGRLSRMGIGTSIFLIAVGAILKFAVTADVSGLELSTVGGDPHGLRRARAGALARHVQRRAPDDRGRAAGRARPRALLGGLRVRQGLGRGLGRRRRAGVDDLLDPPPLGDLAVVQDERDADQLARRPALAARAPDLAVRADHEAVAGLHVEQPDAAVQVGDERLDLAGRLERQLVVDRDDRRQLEVTRGALVVAARRRLPPSPAGGARWPRPRRTAAASRFACRSARLTWGSGWAPARTGGVRSKKRSSGEASSPPQPASASSAATARGGDSRRSTRLLYPPPAARARAGRLEPRRMADRVALP